MKDRLRAFAVDDEVEQDILGPENKTIMVVGGSSAGKTSLVEGLVDSLAKSAKVAIVDMDMGQSHIGPPTTIAWGLVSERFPGWEDVEPRDMYFTGSTSPYGNLLPTVVGAKIIFDKAKLFADKVVIDTTGLIDGVTGRALKWNLIDLIRPDLLLALQREKELEHILEVYREAEAPIVHRLSVPGGVKQRTKAERASYRKGKFSAYFKDSKPLRLSWNRVGIRNFDDFSRSRKSSLLNRLISLRDEQEDDIALAILIDIDFDGEALFLFSPVPEASQIRGIVFGNLRITPDGKQMGIPSRY